MPLAFFKRSEAVDYENVLLLKQRIAEAGQWLHPIPVESTHGIVMDGNHRVTVAALLGLKMLPCIRLRYDDPRVKVYDWRTGAPFDVDRIMDCVGADRMLPQKSTRHLFSPALPTVNIDLAALL